MIQSKIANYFNLSLFFASCAIALDTEKRSLNNLIVLSDRPLLQV